jgi:REP element-mobilizing transposase RayT
MIEPAYKLDQTSRAEVMRALPDVCTHRGWVLLAAHIRTNHVHIVVDAEDRPESVMNAFKTYASRRLNAIYPDERNRRRWARHGSTRWLWTREDVSAAVRYVVEDQGEPMEMFRGDVGPW